jgi:predicted transposase YbfD/YdcC
MGLQQKNLIKRIQQLQWQINKLEEVEMDETVKEDIIKDRRELKKYYQRELKKLKWNFLLSLDNEGGDEDAKLN